MVRPGGYTPAEDNIIIAGRRAKLSFPKVTENVNAYNAENDTGITRSRASAGNRWTVYLQNAGDAGEEQGEDAQSEGVTKRPRKKARTLPPSEDPTGDNVDRGSSTIAFAPYVLDSLDFVPSQTYTNTNAWLQTAHTLKVNHPVVEYSPPSERKKESFYSIWASSLPSDRSGSWKVVSITPHTSDKFPEGYWVICVMNKDFSTKVTLFG